MSVFASTGRTYGDRERTPVPFPHYRCKSTAVQKREAAHSTLTHNCKLTVDHSDGHRCICGKAWERLEKVVGV